jgi:hypothetical protein
MKAGDLFAAALAALLLVAAYYGAFFAWAMLMAVNGGFDPWSDEGVVWFALTAAVLWGLIGALIGRWWVMLVPLPFYLWLRLEELVEFGHIDLDEGKYSSEAWLAIAACALGIGCGLRAWAQERGRA